jgi:hypothetical protein
MGTEFNAGPQKLPKANLTTDNTDNTDSEGLGWKRTQFGLPLRFDRSG